MEENKQELIHSKGFDMKQPISEYGKIKVGVKSLEDATLNLGYLREGDKAYTSKRVILKAIAENDKELMREISEYFYKTSGIYQKVCNYFAYMFRYDWHVVSEVYDEQVKEEKIVKEFIKILSFLDNSYIKKICGSIALNVIKLGAYYGYIADSDQGIVIQELPVKYCRTRYSIRNMPAIEFNMKFFDDCFPDINYRLKVIKLFPMEFAKGYMLYKEGKLQSDNISERNSGWYLLDPAKTIKFNINDNDTPLFINAIPSILDLDAAQDLDRRKQMQKLLKIIIQKLPLDKNGDLIFDVDEARDIHNNAVEMLKNSIGVDVLTTFAEIDSIDLSDGKTATTTDDLEKVERTVYNALGVSKNLFNTDGNLSLEKSILTDEGTMRTLVMQFQHFFDSIVQAKSSNKKKVNFRFYMLETTQYNYKELSKMYKEQMQTGGSKMLPQVALGHSQSSIINTAFFENEILHLSEIMIPPLMSSTLSMEDIKSAKSDKTQSNNSSKSLKDDSAEVGRPEKPDDQKSEKTIQNQESMS